MRRTYESHARDSARTGAPSHRPSLPPPPPLPSAAFLLIISLTLRRRTNARSQRETAPIWQKGWRLALLNVGESRTSVSREEMIALYRPVMYVYIYRN
jgi:hypothetical protein